MDILTSDQHKYGGGSDIARASFPTADHAGPEGDKQRQERHDEQSYR